MSDEKVFVARKADKWFGPLTQLWDFIDARDIDKHVVSLVILWGTWSITRWAMGFAAAMAAMKVSGLEIAAIIGAVIGPYSMLQGYALKVYFGARS